MYLYSRGNQKKYFLEKIIILKPKKIVLAKKWQILTRDVFYALQTFLVTRKLSDYKNGLLLYNTVDWVCSNGRKIRTHHF